MSGVLTNCVYTVKENFYGAPDDVVVSIEIDYRNMNIFANADDGGSYITIHLPYLTLKNLKLNPPAPDFSTSEKAMKRVLEANNAISAMRGRLGADFNRLEHARADLSQAGIQAADAYSRIRDADVAELMTQRVKLSILQNAQQTAQSHTLEMPQQILQLIQSECSKTAGFSAVLFLKNSFTCSEKSVIISNRNCECNLQEGAYP